ncbi:MAG: tetratricopeptide repeat protein [Candidatus Binataceae bacterium]
MTVLDKKTPQERDERLDSWKEIAAHLKRDVRTVQRWEKNERLPVHRKQHGTLGSVYAFKSQLDAWWNEGRIEPAPGAAGASGAQARPLLAVLPLRNLSGDGAQEYFSDGLTEELIAQLSRVEPALLGVIARGSAMKFKNSDKGVDQIGRQVGASYIVDGSVRREQERVRISVQLIRVRDQSHVWAENYDRHLRDILDLQSEVARAVTAEITAKVSASEQSRRAGPRPIDPEAYNAYLQGRFFWNRRTPESLKKAIEHFERAIARDASYAPAHAGLADCYALLASIELGILPPIDAMPKAKNAARRAAELDASLAEAHASLGYAALWFDWDWTAAHQEFSRAMELNPAYPTARQWYAEYLATVDRMEDSVAQYRHALALDPLSPLLHTALGAEYYFERDYDRSIDESQRALELDSNFILAYFNVGRACVQKRAYAKAIAELKKARDLSGESSAMTMALGYAYAAAGKKSEALKMIEFLKSRARRGYVPSFYIGAIYAGLRDVEQSLAWLKKAHQERCDYMVHLAKEAAADPLRQDARFAELVPRAPR